MPVTAEPKATAIQDTSVENNLGLVHACAHRFKGRGIEYDDLYQAGCMGLVKASAAFDAGRGVMFSTYAVPVILGETPPAVPGWGHRKGEPQPEGAGTGRRAHPRAAGQRAGPGGHRE